MRRGSRRILAACAATLMFALLCAGQAWASGSQPYFMNLTGSGQSLTEARYGALAATLPSGEVLIAGGHSESGYLTSAELFSPVTDTFTKLTGSGQSLTEVRFGALAATLPSGEVLIAGGYNGSSLLTSAELFNPATDTFTKLTGSDESTTEPRSFGVAATLPSGEVLIAGGQNRTSRSVSTELFSPATNTFTTLTGSGQSLSEAHYGALAATLPSGQVLVAGGANFKGNFLTSAELLDPATDTFTKLTDAGQSLTEARELGAAATLPSGEVLIAGGYNISSGYLASAELFNPLTDAFTKLTGSAESLAEARSFGITAALPDGQVLIAGGANSTGFLSSAELFFPAAQAQISGGSFGEQTLGERSALGVITVMNVGAQALSIRGATLTGANAADFTLGADACDGVTLALRQECTITVSFRPAGEGAASATLTLTDNESAPTVVNLTGTGVAPARGPQGEKGAAGPQGPPGEKGATAPKGSAGEVELVSCTNSTEELKGKKHKRHCTTKLLKSPVKFTTAAKGKGAEISLVRGKTVYATGRLSLAHGSLRLVLDLNRYKALPAGAYTLTLSWRAGKTTHTSRQRITLE